MYIHIFSFTKQASELATFLFDAYNLLGYKCSCYTMTQFATSPKLNAFSTSAKEQVGKSFSSQDALIFIGACGIAVRMIAPFIKSKTTDPCVLCIDEKGQFVISLLSGHIGGGNEFTLETSELLHATPIISTATDLNNKFAVDVFAKKNHLSISSMTLAKAVSSALLQNQPVGIKSILPLPETLPDGLIPYDLCDHSITLGISIATPCTLEKTLPFKKTLVLTPKQVVIGIGCKKNTPFENIEKLVLDTLEKNNLTLEAIHSISSIDLKKNEPGLIAFCQKYNLPFICYTSEELLTVKGSISSSAFVKSITGVDSVCERAALAQAKSEKLLIPKTAHQGVTVAASLCKITLTF